MRWYYLIEIIKENIDSFNISIITGLITGWFVVLLDSKFNDVKLRQEGFYDDKYRRFQNIMRVRLMINRIIETFRITQEFDESQIIQKNLLIRLALEDAKKEIDIEVGLLKPYHYFRQEYLTDKMKEIIKREQDSFTKVKDLASVKNINEIDLIELTEQKGLLWKVAFDIRREPRKEVKMELLKAIINDKWALVIIIFAIGAIFLG